VEIAMQAVTNPAIADDRMWVSHVNGRSRRIDEMVGEHILSCIAMIERGTDCTGEIVPDWCKAKAPLLIKEAERRGILGEYKFSNRVADGWDA